MVSALFHVWLMSAAVMVAAWYFSMRVRNVGYVDVVWAGLMAAAAVMVSCEGVGSDLPRALVAFLGGIWGARLCIHLLKRVMHEPEDGRYQALRATWNGSPAKFFVFFQMQAVIVVLFSIPFYAAASLHAGHASVWTGAAIAIWLISVFGEYLSDRQLATFRNDPANKGKLFSGGLWRFTRHPNYFGDFLVWWGLFVIACATGTAWWTIAGPVVMSILLMRVSGVTLLEKTMSKRPGYAQYAARTSAFFPRPPKRERTLL